MSTIFANAKINIFLAVTSVRSDGYHNLLSLAVPLSLCDKITLLEAGEDVFKTNDAALLGDNIVVKVVKYLKRYVVKNFSIELEKNIPVMAGFGGGSSDAAAILKFLNKYCEINFSEDELCKIALLFGADCPFFVKNKVALVSGVGERVTELGGNFRANLARYNILLLKPNFGVSTEEAYVKLRTRPELYISEDMAMDLVSGLVASVNGFEQNLPLFNTFSQIVFDRHKELVSLREALPCSMMLSGSGSGCFCIFQDPAIELEIVHVIKSILGKNVFIEKCSVL
ncbi:MAG: 4-(cytidine 5'-diphospho)-2-C-methyl-D-erythritol kinase [Puniceicoccales bacterium]|nr:4-(cytidine 5'-diphospho)-2-C-methyl-D-erythritol kinase [Puniceicoccales bacterium]